MADNIFNRLGNLFQSNIILRKRDDDKLVVKDLNLSQIGLTNNMVDRFNRLMKSSYHGGSYAKTQQATYIMQRHELFRDYELMDNDPIISSALDVYADESTVDNVSGEILNIKTENRKLYEILHNLFYDILNIEFNLWSWIRNLSKYGDFFLQLDIVDKYGVVNIKPLSAYDVERLEDHDEMNPNLIQFVLYGDSKELKESYEVAHFRMLSDANYLPYGKSMIEGARRVFKQLTLMEDAMLIHRIMRAPEKRIFKVDIGNIPPNEVENFMNKMINKMKKTPVIDNKTGEYNLRYNIQSVTEDFFLPVRGGDSGTSIDTLQGLSNDGQIDDIEYLRNKLMAALRIPKAFLGYEEGVGSKATLAAEDVRFARTIERVQKIICSELEKIAIVHLYTQGFDDKELLNFELELTNPSMIHMQEKLELLTQQVDVANNIIENKILSREWIYENLFEFNKHEKHSVKAQIIEDQKDKFRYSQIEMEGNDPAKSGEKVDTEGDSMQEGDWGGSEKDPAKFDINPHGANKEDLKKATSYDRERYGKRDFKHGSPLHPGKGATLMKSESRFSGILGDLKKKYDKKIKSASILNEESLIDD
tara:strand:- start:5124 stop:6893 length:1770 start_codon:yes stop_codon:yes gene_type:complete